MWICVGMDANENVKIWDLWGNVDKNVKIWFLNTCGFVG